MELRKRKEEGKREHWGRVWIAVYISRFFSTADVNKSPALLGFSKIPPA